MDKISGSTEHHDARGTVFIAESFSQLISKDFIGQVSNRVCELPGKDIPFESW